MICLCPDLGNRMCLGLELVLPPAKWLLLHRASFFFNHSPAVPVFAAPHQTTGPILVDLVWQLCHIMWVS